MVLTFPGISQGEWDKVRAVGGHPYVHQQRDYRSGRGNRECCGSRGGRGGRGVDMENDQQEVMTSHRRLRLPIRQTSLNVMHPRLRKHTTHPCQQIAVDAVVDDLEHVAGIDS